MIIIQLTYINEDAVVADIKVTQIGKTSYLAGETFSLDGYQIMAIYTDLSEEDITNQCTFTPNTPLTLEDTEIIISYKEKSFMQSILISDSQEINYTILYDYGDLGESGGWEYKRITDSTDTKDTPFASYTFTQNADNLYIYGLHNSNKNCKAGAFTVNKFDMSQYSAFFIKSNIGTKGPAVIVRFQTFLEDNTDRSKDNTTEYYLFNTPYNSSTLSISKPVVSSNITTTGNRKMVFSIDSWGWYGDVGAYLYHLTIFKPDKIQGLIERANIVATTINEILDNSEVILNNESAINYMITQCTGDFMAAAIQSETFLTALNNSPYKTKVYANEHWAKFLNMVA